MATVPSSTPELSPLKRALLAIEDLQARLDAVEQQRRDPIAIIGVGCRVPGGANTPAKFWDLLHEGRNGVSEIPADRWDSAAYYDPNPDAHGKIATRFAGFLDQVDRFEPQLFGISPREALTMDPQQRLLLEVAWETLEHAGQSPTKLSKTRTGVYFGMCSNDYAQIMMESGDPAVLDMYYISGIGHSVASGRVSYVLGLQGPSVTIDTACSSSLVAVHLACQALRAGECRLALAGGVNAIISPEIFVTMSRARMLALDGRCKSFDAAADGFVRGEGCGVIALKRLSDAVADGDTVLALIRGSAANQDGPSSGLTAPNGPSQESVIRDALASAGLSPADVSYIEAHGTGTSLGDPIEMQALGAVFGPGRDPKTPLIVGSLKTNVGHLEAAAGVAGLIKVVLALQNREIPKHLHFQNPSPHIPWDRIPVKIPVERMAWAPVSGRRIAGVSSFGFSGTNAHVVLEEAPAVPARPAAGKDRPLHLLTLSARTEGSLGVMCREYAEKLATAPAGSFADICHTTTTGRAHLAHRLVVSSATAADAVSKLHSCAAGETPAGVVRGSFESSDRPKIAFLFTGQGSQYAGMGRALYETSPVFARAIDRCDAALRGRLGRSLLEVIHPPAGAKSPIDETQFTQPALFAIEYALCELWRSWGVQPSFVMGHSVGEYVAACVAGVFSVEDGLALIAERARLMQAQPAGGRMVAVMAPVDTVREALAPMKDRVSIAALNGPRQTVVSGAGDAIERLLPGLTAAGIKTRELTVSHAFHSPLMDPMLAAFEQAASAITLLPPKLRLVSNLTGKVANAAEITRPAYWRQHVRDAVQFAPSMQTLGELGCTVFLEVGPNPVLLGLGRGCLESESNLWLPSLRSGRDDWSEILGSLARLHAAGIEIDWAAFERDTPRRKVDLPTYPFSRERYWIASRGAKKTNAMPSAPEGALHPLAARRVDSPSLKDVVFETPLSAHAPAFVADHRVFDRIIYPATGHLETVRTCARLGLGQEPWSLEGIVIGEALAVGDDETRRMQVIFNPEEGGARRFEVVSSAATQPAEWRTHASGTIRRTGSAPAPATVDLELARKGAIGIDIESFYAGYERRGLGFGPRFHGVRNVWRADKRAIGLIEAPGALASELAPYDLHPALLDACIQIVGAAASDPAAPADDTILFMPLGIDSFRVHAACPPVLWSIVEIEGSTTAETFRANIRATDESGRLLVELLGMSFKRASRASVERATRPSLEDWFYRVAWHPLDSADTGATPTDVAFPEPASLAPMLREKLAQFARESGLARFGDLRPRIDAVCAAYICRAFASLGCTPSRGESFEAAALARDLGIKPEQRRLFGRLIEILAEDGVASFDGTRGTWLRPIPLSDIETAVAQLWKEFPEFEAALAMTERCGTKFAEALTGHADPLQLIFPAGDLTTAEKIYQYSPPARTYNPLVCEAIRAAIAARPSGRIRVLEVGAGTGSTSAHVLTALPADRTDYVFTDMSPHFLAKAEAKFTEYPFVRYQLFDLEKDAAAQGLEPGGFDIVIGANCIHATAELRPTLANLRGLLAPGGWLVMIEVTRPQRWFDITFGMTDGWWRFRDADLRTRYPLLTRVEWTRLLMECGYSSVVTEPSTPSAGEESADEALIISRAGTPAQPPAGQRRWLLLADQGGTATALANQLCSLGDSCELVPSDVDPSSREEMDQLVERTLQPSDRPLTGIVNLRPLDAKPLGALHADGLETEQQRLVGSTLLLVQALARLAASTPPRLWLCTRGAQAANHSEKNISPAAAALWGLGRVIALEHPELRCTRLDLDPDDTRDEIAVFTRLLDGRGDEDQFAIRSGTPLLARLDAHAPKASQPAPFIAPVIGQPYRLGFDSRGSLENLRLGTMERRPPGRGEVEIRVRATALNFRDVMNVMGLYPGDPGPLGAECSGEIVAVGEGVADFVPGDAVIALAGGSFSAYVTTETEWIARKPTGMSFEQAASLPVAYVTAHFTLNHLGKLRAGEKVLIHAAAGGVGLAAVALARRAGAEIFGTAGSPEKRALLTSLGVAHVLDSRSLGFADEVLRITGGRGVDVVLNSLADKFVDRSFEVIARGGRFLEIGKRGIWEPARVAGLNKDIDYHVVDWGVDARANPPLIGGMLRELMQAFARGEIAPLPHREFSMSEAVVAFRFMAQGRHIGKLVVSHAELHLREAQAAASPVRPDATYLVTGGLRGIGFLTARWLVERGARHLVLTGRRAADAATQAELDAFSHQGVAIHTAQTDAADAPAMRALIARVRATMPPLRGVIHSAGSLDDGVLLQQDWARFQTVFAPKVNGSLILHEATQGDPLDFFVLYSSVAGVFGSAGQGNHAAANAFMDTLAAARRAAGLPGLSISWGAWSGAGAAVDRGVTQRATGGGYGLIEPASGLRALEALLQQDAAHFAVSPTDWPRFLAKFTRGGRVAPFLASRAQAASQAQARRTATSAPVDRPAATAAKSVSLADRLAKTAPNQRRAVVVDQIRRDAARVLGLAASAPLPNNKPLTELGLDSLMAVELRNALGTAVGRNLSATLLFDYPTVDALTGFLCKSVLGIEEKTAASAAPATTPAPAATTSAVLGQIEDLDDDEIDRLLQQRGLKNRE